MKVFPFTLTAGQADQIQQRGRFVRCLTGAYAFDLTVVKSNGESLGIFAGFQAGLAVMLPDFFDQLRITNGSTAQTVELLVHDDRVDDNRLVGTVNITGGLDTKPLAPTLIDTWGRVQIASASATQILAAGTKRGKVILQNCSANYIAIGYDSTVTYTSTATGGLILAPSALGAGYPGGSVEIETNTTVYGRADTGATNDLRVFSAKHA